MADKLSNLTEIYEKIKCYPRYIGFWSCEEEFRAYVYFGYKFDMKKYLDGEFRLCCNIINPDYNRDLDAEILDELEATGLEDIGCFTYYDAYILAVSKGGVYHFWANKKVFLTLTTTADMLKYAGISPEMIGIRKNTNKHIYVMSSNDPLNRKLEFILIDRDNPSDYTNIKTDIVLNPTWQHHLIKGRNLLDSYEENQEYRLVLYDNKNTILVYNLNKTKLVEFDRKIIIPGKNISIHICGPCIAIENNISGKEKFRNIDDL